MSDSNQITMNTDLLAAIAKWASDDVSRPIGAVVFRDGEVIATNGHQLVRVPMATCATVVGKPTFAVRRHDLLAAVAAQNAIARDGIEPAIDHDIVASDGGDPLLADGPTGDRTITLWSSRADVVIDLGGATLTAPAADLRSYPSAKMLDEAMPPIGEVKHGPLDAIVFDPRCHAAIHAMNTASSCRIGGVQCIGWGGHESPMVFVNLKGIRMAVMPMKTFEKQAGGSRG